MSPSKREDPASTRFGAVAARRPFEVEAPLWIPDGTGSQRSPAGERAAVHPWPDGWSGEALDVLDLGVPAIGSGRVAGEYRHAAVGRPSDHGRGSSGSESVATSSIC